MSLRPNARKVFVPCYDLQTKENFFVKPNMKRYFVHEKIKGANPQSLKCIQQQALVSSFLPAKLKESLQEFHLNLKPSSKRQSYQGKERFKKFRAYEKSQSIDLGRETVEILNGRISVTRKKEQNMSQNFYLSFNTLQDILSNKVGGENVPSKADPKKVFASIFRRHFVDPPVKSEEKQWALTTSTFYTRRNN